MKSIKFVSLGFIIFSIIMIHPIQSQASVIENNSDCEFVDDYEKIVSGGFQTIECGWVTMSGWILYDGNTNLPIGHCIDFDSEHCDPVNSSLPSAGPPRDMYDNLGNLTSESMALFYVSNLK